MRFSTFTAAAIASLVSVASAAVGSNGFTHPIAGDTITAGQDFNITWINVVGSTVTLQLRSGYVGNLAVVDTIATGISNVGYYVWHVPSTESYASDYAISINWGTDDTNYSDRVILNSQFTSSAVTATSAMTSTSVSGSSTTVITTSSAVTSTVASSATTTGSSMSTTSGSSSTAASSSGSSTTSKKSTSTSGTSTSTSAAATTSAPSSANANLASPLAIIMCIFAAIMYTN